MAQDIEDRREAERQTWQYRAVQATRGNQTMLGTIVLAVIGRNAKHPPWFEPGAEIADDGILLANFVDRGLRDHGLVPVARLSQVVDEFRRLADHIKLTDDERKSMFDALRKWIAKDHRALKEPIQ